MDRDEYFKMAAVEDSMWYYRALHAHLRRELCRTLGGRQAKILDAGCGTGGLIRRLRAGLPDFEWTGIDAQPVACELARARTGVSIIEGSVESLPFADGIFDAVVSADVLYHVKDDRKAIRESFRVLRPGGLFVVNTPVYRWLWSYHDVATHAQRRYQNGELAGKLVAAGFGLESATHWNALTLPLIVVRRKIMPPPAEGSDVKEYPVWIAGFLSTLMKMEQSWIERGGRWAFGSSELVTARKPAQSKSISR
jgi:SAM-dependent methyltransferase